VSRLATARGARVGRRQFAMAVAPGPVPCGERAGVLAEAFARVEGAFAAAVGHPPDVGPARRCSASSPSSHRRRAGSSRSRWAARPTRSRPRTPLGTSPTAQRAGSRATRRGCPTPSAAGYGASNRGRGHPPARCSDTAIGTDPARRASSAACTTSSGCSRPRLSGTDSSECAVAHSTASMASYQVPPSAPLPAISTSNRRRWAQGHQLSVLFVPRSRAPSRVTLAP
jgi:hypothetical protein